MMEVPKQLLLKFEKIKTLEFEDDVLICGYPRTGTTWLQEMVWITQHDGDLEQASAVEVGCRVPFLESEGYEWEHSVDDLDQHPHPRVMKSHLAPSLFESKLDNLKMIVSVRNPKDTYVSLLNYMKLRKDIPFPTDMGNMFDLFIGNGPPVEGAPMLGYFDWYMQVIPMLDHENVMLVKYEDQKKDLVGGIKGIATFLGKNLDESIIQAIAQHCSFSNMKQNKMVNQTKHEIYDQTKGDFMNKGKIGTWRDVLTAEESKAIDEKYERTLKKTGLELDFN